MKREYSVIFLPDGGLRYTTPCPQADGTRIGSQQCITCPHFIAIHAIAGVLECRPPKPQNEKAQQLLLNI